MADLIKYAFVAGEISPKLLSRSDLEKYDLAMALARNWFVDYTGGLSTRPGSRFVDFVKADDKDTKFFSFEFGAATAETYVIVFGDEYVRFLQDGAYVLEDEVVITDVTQAAPGVVTAAAHGFANGDWVKIFDVAGMPQVNGRTFLVANVAANTFELLDPLTGAGIDTSAYGAYTAGGVVQRIYTIASPYAAEDLETLRASQSRSVIYLTHPAYRTCILTRVAHTNWTLAPVAIGNGLAAPTNLAINTAAGTAGVAFVVTAVDIDGAESVASGYVYDSTITDYTQAAGQAKVTWTAVAGAVLYRVYRTHIITTGADINRAMPVGFIGFAHGPQFIDNNIIPDFTITPPAHIDPFANGAIEFITVTAGGTGYTNASVVSITTSTGSGFVGYPVVSSGGVLLAIVIVNGGHDYVAGDTISVSVGTGATFTKVLSEAVGNDPSVSSVFQQRKIYAASYNKPLTVWGSQPGEYENFDVSTIIQEDDAYEFDLDTEKVAPIRHLLATRSGLVIISQTGIWQLTGGQGVAVTPTNALADPQSFTGCSLLPPLEVDTDIIYQEGKGGTVRLLSYNDYTKVFAGQDLSILSSHLTSPNTPIMSWAYAADPFKLVHMVRSDGVMNVLALVKEQNVYGWTTSSTKGLYKDVISIQENLVDVVYHMVQRFVNGRWTRFIEQEVRRDFICVEDAWCVDSGLTNGATYPAATLVASAATGDAVVFTASAAVFSAGDVGKVLRIGCGKAIINTFTSTTEVIGKIMQPITVVIPEDPNKTPLPAVEGEWTLDTPLTAVTGLWHLEGELVSILADGSVLAPQVVEGGQIAIAGGATRIIVGLGYQCVAKTLPPTTPQKVIESKRKRPVKMLARVHDTRGLKSGTAVDHLYPFKERTTEAYAEPTRLQYGYKPISVHAGFDREAQVYFVQDDPLPATLLGIISDMDIGDVDARGN